MTLYVLGLCVAVLFLGGLSADLWRVIAVRSDLATMADGAAAAAADGLDEAALREGALVLDPERAALLAREHLDAQSDAGIIDDVAIDTGDGGVTVRLRSAVRFTLLGVFLDAGEFDVTASAVAEPRRRE
ncbi:MAG: hypothetical protein M5T61_12035 [Acidimicrobiia bacterium]|nr:hypothetical protein [Acidimicrobiia bacterium]